MQEPIKPTKPNMQKDHPELVKLDEELSQLKRVEGASFAWQNKWRDKESLMRKIPVIEKQRKDLLERLKVDHENAMAKYEKDIISFAEDMDEYSKFLKEEEKAEKIRNPATGNLRVNL